MHAATTVTTWRRRLARLLLLAALVYGAGFAVAAAQEGAGRVLVATLDEEIGPVTADYVVDGLERAEEEGYEAYVLVVDTPGGLDTSMRKITRAFLGADVPVVVHVAPRGARAASAGAFVTLASHVAAMAPGTVIGAATPVDLEGGDVERKIVNDAAALAASMADLRDRNVEFYVDTVREGRSATAEEAVEIEAVELLADSRDDLLDAVDGWEVELAGGRTVTLDTAGAAVDEHEMGLFQQILQVLADPNLAFLFMSIGTLGIIYELASPGVGLGGAVGVVMVVLALFSLSVLTPSVAGIVFLLAAAGLFAAELFAPGIGIFAALGAGALVLSGLFLFDDTPDASVSLAVVVPTALVVALAVVLAGRLVVRARRAPSSTGIPSLVGRTATVRRTEAGVSQVVVDGSWWSVRGDEPLAPGDEVRVVDVEGVTLVVEPLERSAGRQEGARDG